MSLRRAPWRARGLKVSDRDHGPLPRAVLTVKRQRLRLELYEVRVLLERAVGQVEEGVQEADGAARVGDLESAAFVAGVQEII